MQQLKRLGIVLIILINFIFVPHNIGVLFFHITNNKCNFIIEYWTYGFALLLIITFLFLILRAISLKIYYYIKTGKL